MIKFLVLIFILFFIAPVYADIKGMIVNYQNCPDIKELIKNKKWIEHTKIWPQKQIEKYFSLPLIPVKPNITMRIVPVIVNRGVNRYQWSEIVWVIYKSKHKNFSGKNMTCFVDGSVAYYVEVKNVNGWPPKVEFTPNLDNEIQLLKNGTIGLIELRWFDLIENKRHRWFNKKLAIKIQWVKDKNYSPIGLPRAINVLD